MSKVVQVLTIIPLCMAVARPTSCVGEARPLVGSMHLGDGASEAKAELAAVVYILMVISVYLGVPAEPWAPARGPA